MARGSTSASPTGRITVQNMREKRETWEDRQKSEKPSKHAKARSMRKKKK